MKRRVQQAGTVSALILAALLGATGTANATQEAAGVVYGPAVDCFGVKFGTATVDPATATLTISKTWIYVTTDATTCYASP